MIPYQKRHWTSHLLDIGGSMLLEILGRVLACVLWAAVVVSTHHLYAELAVSPTVHTLVGAALALLLVFRTNASYDRFWEGRRHWGSIINDARDLAREACVFLREDPARRDAVLFWTIAFVHAAMHRIRGTRGIG